MRNKQIKSEVGAFNLLLLTYKLLIRKGENGSPSSFLAYITYRFWGQTLNMLCALKYILNMLRYVHKICRDMILYVYLCTAFYLFFFIYAELRAKQVWEKTDRSNRRKYILAF